MILWVDTRLLSPCPITQIYDALPLCLEGEARPFLIACHVGGSSETSRLTTPKVLTHI